MPRRLKQTAERRTINQLLTIVLQDLSHNQLGGTIDDLMQCQALEELYLAGNAFVGSLPPTIQYMHHLRVLSLDSNRLSGPLPSTLGVLVELRGLGLAYNNFTSIPKEVLKLKKLRTFSTEGNDGITVSQAFETRARRLKTCIFRF